MPLVTSRVDVFNELGKISREIDDLAREAVAIAAREGGTVAAQIAATRRGARADGDDESQSMSNIRVSSPTRTPDGWRASFVSPVKHAWFQNYGTLGNRRKALKQSPRTNRTRAPGTGVEPLGFLNAGLRAGRRAMLNHIRQGLPR